MSAPRSKRQFAGAASDPSQRQITSFFSPRSPTTPVSASPQPLLPASVQSNLLNVGMRVRKSVPEGYKTGTYSSFKLWSDVDNAHVPVSPSPPATQPARSATTASAQRELVPFCGIHKVGGLAAQQPLSYTGYDGRDGGELDNVPGLDEIPGLVTSSQESVESNATTSTASSSRKRIFREREDDSDGNDAHFAPTWHDGNTWVDGDVSPRSLAPAGWGNMRVLAVPKSIARRKGTATTVVPPVEQENMAVDDFEEADFLVDGMDVSDQ
ncbi:hypothetical protein ACRALDRAFT_2025426 [Sodiomyces alcalophilus JCM 7366]|uniref:uncharacterized protein n=1 Tax=Sodiomyces alcalophilus JCM 7366 TaxID=591952 RepID=UPI0039B58B4D